MSNMIDFSEKVLQIKNLKKYFKVGSGRRKLMIPAVDDVSIDVYKREVFGVVGESGSGKTTLGRTIIKLYQPTDGTVTLNNIIISVGIQGYYERINQIKKKLKNDIVRLNPSKIKAMELRQHAEKEIQDLEFKKQELFKQRDSELTSLSAQFDKFRSNKYQVTALMQLERQKVIFDFNQKVMKAKQSLQNEALLKFNNEIKISKDKLNHKLNGLKDSAALDRETIEKRIVELKSQHLAEIDAIKALYTNQIKENETKMLNKAQVTTLINQYQIQKNKQLTVIKTKYQKEILGLVEPNKKEFTLESNKIKSKFNKQVIQIDRKIKAIRSKLNQTIFTLPKIDLTVIQNTQIQAQVKQLKIEAKLAIQELNAKINEARRINNSKDTLKESQKMQMIFQDPISSLNPRMTVKEIISEGLVIAGNTSKAEIDKKVAEVLDLVGLSPEYASRYPHEFSGGQRQRIGVARALIMNPNVIIADEPISALDVSIRAQIINLLFNLREKLGLTILFIAHDLSVVRFFCDRIAVMYNGKVVEMATSEELFKNPLHPYTISLLSAIPQPDPDYEKNRTRINYNPRQHQYSPSNMPSLREVGNQHFVLASEDEFKQYQNSYKPNLKKGELSK